MSKDKDKPVRQWHPLFAALLRPMLQDHYDVQTNFPVGDAPRAADILLLKRTSEEPTPFRGLWRHLTAWNIVEFKGPTVDARVRDLDLLAELGLGIDRRLNEDQRRQGGTYLEREQVSFWYIVRDLGRRFLPDARRLLGELEELAPGLWRSQVMQRLLFLVSSEKFATEPDSVPLHLLFKRSPDHERELARVVLEQPGFLKWYGTVFGVLHPQVWREVSSMAGNKRKGLEPDFSVLVEDFGVENVVKAIGIEQVMEAVGPEMVQGMDVAWLLSKLRPAQLEELREQLKQPARG
jgi:hypothetical protein